MALTAGVVTLVSKTSTTASVNSVAASGGVGPYTYQWYRSTTPTFSPGGGNIVSGATSLTLNDSGLTANTQYYYKMVSTDTGDSNATVTSAPLGVATEPVSPIPNQFQQAPVVGMLDLRFNTNTIAVQIDSSESGDLVAGQAVKIVDSAGGVPKVIACDADADNVLGFLNYNIKNRIFVAGDAAEISMFGNVMFLVATAAIARGVQVVSDVSTIGGVAAVSGSGGENIVGWALDKASAAGQLIRVMLQTPSFATDS